MKSTKTIAATVLLACLALAGCESKQQRTAKLQAEYDAAAKQYAVNCPAVATKGAGDYFGSKSSGTEAKPRHEAADQQKQQSARCTAEAQRLGSLEQQLNQQ